MKVCIIGGTGLLGSQAAKELIEKGHSVRAIALPPLPQKVTLPQQMEITFNNYLDMSDEEIELMFDGCEGFVFAAGVDERVETVNPIYDLYDCSPCSRPSSRSIFRRSSLCPFSCCARQAQAI